MLNIPLTTLVITTLESLWYLGNVHGRTGGLLLSNTKTMAPEDPEKECCLRKLTVDFWDLYLPQNTRLEESRL